MVAIFCIISYSFSIIPEFLPCRWDSLRISHHRIGLSDHIQSRKKKKICFLKPQSKLPNLNPDLQSFPKHSVTEMPYSSPWCAFSVTAMSNKPNCSPPGMLLVVFAWRTSNLVNNMYSALWGSRTCYVYSCSNTIECLVCAIHFANAWDTAANKAQRENLMKGDRSKSNQR